MSPDINSRRSVIVPNLALLLFAALLGASTGGCESADAQAAELEASRAARAVLTEPVRRGDVEVVVRYAADLEAESQVTLTSLVSDRIVEMAVEEGDRVEAGQVVARVRSDRLRQGLARVDAELASLDAQLAFQKDELRRARRLHDQKVVTRQALDQAESSLKSSQARRRSLLASRAQTRISVKDAVVRAPVSGVVAHKRARVGDMASPGAPLCTLMQVDRMKLLLRLTEADIPRVRMGQEVSVQVDAYPGEHFRGEVARILPYVDPATRTNTVEVLLDNPVDEASGQRRLKPGMFGRAELVVEQRSAVALAPNRALLLDADLLARQRSDESLRRAFVVDASGHARQRTVQLGARQGERWEILSGLQEGEQVVVRGQQGLVDGQAVQAQERGEQVAEVVR